MSIEKQKPERDKAFLRWVHEKLGGGRCCLCLDEPWTELHHFGGDGGMGMKPSDYLICRICRPCHDQYGSKMRRMHWGENSERLIVMAHMQRDALIILQLYIRYQQVTIARPTLADVRQAIYDGETVRCAIEELNQWWWADAPYRPEDPREQREWIIHWADCRAAALIDDYQREDDADDED